MPNDVDLATAFAEFSAKGLEKLMSDTKSLGKEMTTTVGAMSKAEQAAKALGKAVSSALSAPGKFVDGLAKKIEGLAGKLSNSGLGKAARTFSLGGSLGVGGIIAGASQGTVEGDQFAKSLERLTRIVGDQFAPYLRMATEAINQLATWFKNLDTATQASIAKWAMIVTGVAGFIALLPVAIGFLGTLVAAFATLLSPIGLVIAGLAVAGAAFAGFFDDQTSNSEGAAGAIEGSQKGWIDSVMGWVETLVSAFGKAWNKIMDWASQAATFVAKVWRETTNGIAIALAKAAEAAGVVPEGTVNTLMEDIKNERQRIEKNPIDLSAWKIDVDKLDEKVKNLGAGFRAKASDLEGAFDKINKAGQGGGFNRSFTSRFEGGQDTFERIQLGLINSSDNPQKATMKSAQEIATNTAMMATSIKKVADEWPPVR